MAELEPELEPETPEDELEPEAVDDVDRARFTVDELERTGNELGCDITRPTLLLITIYSVQKE